MVAISITQCYSAKVTMCQEIDRDLIDKPDKIEDIYRAFQTAIKTEEKNFQSEFRLDIRDYYSYKFDEEFQTQLALAASAFANYLAPFNVNVADVIIVSNCVQSEGDVATIRGKIEELIDNANIYLNIQCTEASLFDYATSYEYFDRFQTSFEESISRLLLKSTLPYPQIHEYKEYIKYELFQSFQCNDNKLTKWSYECLCRYVDFCNMKISELSGRIRRVCVISQFQSIY